MYVTIGNSEVLFNSNFRLYFTTRLANPTFETSVYSQTIIVDFNITSAALENNLLCTVLHVLNPELDEQRNIASIEYNHCIEKLVNLEKCLLSKLGTTMGNILDDVYIVTLFEETKLNVTSVTIEMNNSKHLLANYELEIKAYNVVTKKAANLFFVLADMAKINSMYQYGLESFLEIFVEILKSNKDNSTLSICLNQISIDVARRTYEFGSCGMFNKDRVLFSFQIALRLELCNEKITQSEIDFFLNDTTANENSPVNWLSNQEWSSLHRLEENCSFNGLTEHFLKYENEWHAWYNTEAPESNKIPGDFSKEQNPFQVNIIKLQ